MIALFDVRQIESQMRAAGWKWHICHTQCIDAVVLQDSDVHPPADLALEWLWQKGMTQAQHDALTAHRQMVQNADRKSSDIFSSIQAEPSAAKRKLLWAQYRSANAELSILKQRTALIFWKEERSV